MNKRCISFVSLAMFVLAAKAQQTPQQLEEVVVTDSRFELKRENSGKMVITISEEELEKNQGKTLAEIINAKSGFEVNGSRSNAGQNISTFVRGGNNRQVLVIIDGIQVSDPSSITGAYDLRLIDISQIASVEIVKGAASTLYGNNAATAVINITTKKSGDKPIEAFIQSSVGTNQSQKEDAYNPADFSNALTLRGSAGELSYVAGFSQQYTDGLSAVIDEDSFERDPFSKINGILKLGYRFTEQFNLTISGNYDKYNAAFDNSFPLEDAPFESRSEQVRFTASPSFTYKNGSLVLNAAYNRIQRDITSGITTELDAENYVIDLYNKYTFNDKFYTIIGVNHINNKAVFETDTDFSITDPYVNAVWVSDFGLNMNAGMRMNNHSEYGSHFTYNLNPSYVFKLNDDYLKILGSFSTSYITPTLTQLFGRFGPNPDLEPEENRTLEGGVEYRNNSNLRISGVFFNRFEENFIDFVTLNVDPFEGIYQNLDQDFTVQGLELELEAQPINKVSFSANYTFTESKDRIALRIPKHKANASLAYDVSEDMLVSVNYQFTDERLDLNEVDLDSFSIVDFYVSHMFMNKKMKVFANVNNLLNEDYLEVAGFMTRGRNVRIGFSLTL
ncbi:TonB-dependent receptor plug domain-containing protein [Ascidiimonas aurantiaca]|uniref:TonB-dependent receptor plug domain-containing protein n=1 Tax=Ascidiimonas aurantiaca TaxID=1685432 RepID=UPI0030EE7BA7